MNSKKIITLFAVFYFSISFAQKPAEVTVKLRDGSNVTGTTSLADINLVTDFGKLIIPVKSVNSIQVGIPLDKTIADKALSFLKQLNNNSDDIKKGAYDELVKLGIKAIPAIINFTNDPKNQTEYTGDYTPDNALAEIKAANFVDDATSDKDILSIDNQYTMGGTYEFNKLDVKTEYGNLSIPKEKIKTIDITYINESGSNEFSFKLIASKNISGNNNGGWLKTGIMLKSGQKFSVIATGEITLASLSNQKYHPNGSATESTSDYTNDATTYPTYGNVVYKIGEQNTTALRAGAKYNGTSTNAGMLYLSIYETVFNAANTGSYSVKVILK
ncbi:MAG TPA: hypothetical protein VKG26_16885 [Bacteroidia bacterium]|nr:hypothetical protein [Bacteroidia bacterium]